MVRRVLLCLMILFALSANAMAASNPMIVQTGPLVNVVGLLSALGGGTLLDQVPGTSIYLLDLPNLPVITPCWKRFLALGSSSRTGTLSIPHAARWTF